MKKGSISATELMARLNADPEWQARRAKKDEEIQRLVAEDRHAEAPLVEELRAAGFAVESVWDLTNTGPDYPKALPILLKHMGRSYPDAVRDGIARALAVPEAKFGWRELKDLYEREGDKGTRTKDGLAVAIANVATDEMIEEVIRLVHDKKHGGSRLLLLSALERSKDPRARAALMDLGADPQLKEEVQVILRRMAKRKKGTTGKARSGTSKPIELSEASMNFDAEHLEPFLERVSLLATGFDSDEIAKVVSVLNELDVDEEQQLEFTVTWEAQRVPLRIRISVDDVDSPDVYFYAPTTLSKAITDLFEEFCRERGI